MNLAGKRLLVLGASMQQLEFIEYAVAEGCIVHTLDYLPDNPGHRVSHHSHIVSTVDREAVASLAESIGADAVVCPGTDVAVPSVAAASSRLGLPGPSVQAAEVLCSKIEFRDLVESLELPVPRRLGEGGEQSGPWVVKPELGSGGKGITVLDGLDQLAGAKELAASFSVNGRVVIEEFLVGSQCTAEGLMRDGKIVFMAVSDRLTGTRTVVATHGHRFPSGTTGGISELLSRYLHAVFSRVGYKDGPFDCDFVVSDGEVFLLELALRLGGNFISQAVRLAYGVDMFHAALTYSLVGSPPSPVGKDTESSVVLVLLGQQRRGVLTLDPREFAELEREPWVLRCRMFATSGDFVEGDSDGRGCLGYVIADGLGVTDAGQLRRDIMRRLSGGVLS